MFSRKILSNHEITVKIQYSVDGIRNAMQLNSTIIQRDIKMDLGLHGVIEVPDGFVLLHCDRSVKNVERQAGCG